MGKDKVYIPPVAPARLIWAAIVRIWHFSKNEKFSFFLLYSLLHPFRFQEGFEIVIYVKFGKLHLLWMIKII